MRLQKKTLVVSWGLPPALAGSSIIISNLAKGFEADEMVLAGEYWPGPTDDHWKEESGKTPAIHFIHRQWQGKGQKTVRLLLFPIILWRLLRVFRKTKCQQVLAVYPNEIYTFMALIVARWHDVPFYSYFHNTYLDNRSGIKRLFANWLQPKIFRNSRVVFVMSDGMKEVMEREYPNERFVSLVHSFHGQIPESQHSMMLTRNLKIAFIGNLNDSNKDAFGRVKWLLDEFPDCELTTYSGTPDAVFLSAGISGSRVTHTRVGFDDLVDALKKHDILFLPHGFEGGMNDIEYATIFPTRTIPYLLAGVPIVAHSPPRAFLTKWLRKHDCAEIVETKEREDLVRAIENLIQSSDRQKMIIRNALEAARQFHISKVSEALCTVINGTNDECGD